MRGIPPLRLATRGSPLARWQAAHVAAALARPVEVLVVRTEGDRRADVPITAMAGRGVFVKEVQAAVLDGRADLAVHSAKDLTTTEMPGLVIAAVPRRGDARDALVGSTLADLPVGALVATGSVRRRAQLAALRPDLTFAPLRGAIDTRLGRAGGYSAIVMAAAALSRLGRRPSVVDVLGPTTMVPQVGQGALAVECRGDDDEVRALLAPLDHPPSHRALEAERAWLGALGGGCDLPAGALAEVAADGTVLLDALLASPDGHSVLRAQAHGPDPTPLGHALAHHLLVTCGGASLLPPYRTA